MQAILDELQVTAKDYHKQLQQMVKKVNLTIAEWKLLTQVTDGIDTQDKLSQAMELDNSTLSRQLKSLEQKKAIEHQAKGRDHRQLTYQVTAQGQAQLATLTTQNEMLEQRVFKMWSDEEQTMLRILLKRLGKSLSKVVD
ncbi:MarR family winged helix-turn-helix transcriptional regulator [Weissella kandleri]|uniref:MarR family winged helix-turn-helix transcriptional regulator n=1 Tax=Weissella kandleri TaxID=1616 RepID=UPI00387ED572